MFYSGNDNYMQDLYFYNQMPNNTYNPYASQNPNMMNMPGMYMGQNPNFLNNTLPNQNLTNLYPSIYKIINPVVSRVVQNSNYQFLNEDTLNNMVETVYSIVDGQIEYGDEPISSKENLSNTNNNQVTNQTVRTTETTKQNANFQTTRNDSLLKDIIKILIIKELLSKSCTQNRQFSQPPYYGMPQNF